MISYPRQDSKEQSDVSQPSTEDHVAPAPRVSVQAFCETVETAAAVQSAGEDRRLGKAHLKIQMGGMPAAIEAYRTAPTPNVIILETDARGDILVGLDQLASVCDAGTRVIVIGHINDVGFYREFKGRDGFEAYRIIFDLRHGAWRAEIPLLAHDLAAAARRRAPAQREFLGPLVLWLFKPKPNPAHCDRLVEKDANDLRPRL